MSDDIYDDDSLNVLQFNEISPIDPLLHAPDAIIAVGGLTHHHGADYGLPDTTVTVVGDVQVVHDGVVYGSGETAVVPSAVASYWARSSWATMVSDQDTTRGVQSNAGTESASPGTAPTKARATPKQTAAGRGRRG